MENSNDKDWLVESRSRIQCLLLELYKFLKDNRGKLVQRKFERSVFGLLVGTAFSLWRAAFLVSQADRDWPNILKQAEDFLDILVEDNAINYPQDKKTRNWTVGYYLNNARYRLVRVRGKFAEVTDPGQLAQIPEFQQFDDVQKPGGIDETDLTVVWNKTYNALRAAFELLRKANEFHQSQL